MKHMALTGIVAAVALLAGCENKELVTCREGNQALQKQAATLQQELGKARSTIQQKDAEIAKIKSDNVEMQQKAMESIMTMLKKEEERSKKLQASVAEKDQAIKAEQSKASASQSTVQQLQQDLNQIKAELNKANQTIESLKAELSKANQMVETLKAQAAQSAKPAEQAQ